MLYVKNLTKNYKNFSLDCSLEVKKGRITGLIGENGSGKSTTFKSILGLISTDGGTVTLFGKDIKDFTIKDKERLGVVLSDSGFSGYLTVKDIIPVLKSMYKNFDYTFFLRCSEQFNLPLNKKIKEFSTGMKAKLKLLIAISHKADLLILDEPTVGLDVVARDELLSVLREYMQQNDERAVLISSHISSDLETLCDDIYMINNGKTILHENTDVILDSYALLKVDNGQFCELDKRFIICTKTEPYGISCLTNQKQYYIENYPEIAVENGSIDNVILMMIKGTKL